MRLIQISGRLVRHARRLEFQLAEVMVIVAELVIYEILSSTITIEQTSACVFSYDKSVLMQEMLFNGDCRRKYFVDN